MRLQVDIVIFVEKLSRLNLYTKHLLLYVWQNLFLNFVLVINKLIEFSWNNDLISKETN